PFPSQTILENGNDELFSVHQFLSSGPEIPFLKSFSHYDIKLFLKQIQIADQSIGVRLKSHDDHEQKIPPARKIDAHVFFDLY
ncbi:MAG: hypothetical protein M0Z37_10130, partial [Nitrospiraceae bacterium]|nr:hypothetical protein [Nitrospiraceae bacterium]